MINFKRKSFLKDEWFPTERTLYYRYEDSPMEGVEFRKMKATLDKMKDTDWISFWGMTGRRQEEDRDMDELFKIIHEWSREMNEQDVWRKTNKIYKN